MNIQVLSNGNEEKFQCVQLSFSNIILPSQSESFCVNGVSIKVSCTCYGCQQGIIYMYIDTCTCICFHCQGAWPKNCSKTDPKDPGAVLQDRGRVSHQTVDRDPGSRHGQTVGPDQPRNRSVQYYTVRLCSSICLSIHLVLFSVYFGVTNFWLLLKILEIKLKKLCSVHPCIIYTWQFFCLSDSILFVKGRQNSIAAKLLKF